MLAAHAIRTFSEAVDGTTSRIRTDDTHGTRPGKAGRQKYPSKAKRIIRIPTIATRAVHSVPESVSIADRPLIVGRTLVPKE